MAENMTSGKKAAQKAWMRIIVGSIIAGIITYVLLSTFLKKPIDGAIGKLNNL